MDMPTPEEMARADMARDPAVAAIYANGGQSLTGDDIDWKKLHDEDTQTARDFAQDKGWDPDTFADPSFCAACSFKGDGAFHDLNVHAHRSNTKRCAFDVCVCVVGTTARCPWRSC